jgi:hypothetical protein
MVRNRREFLGTGAALAAVAVYERAVVPAWAVAGRAFRAGELTVVAVTRLGDDYAGLVRSLTGQTELRRLTLGDDAGLQPGDRLGPALPADMTPVVVAATSGGFIVGGGRTVIVGEVPSLPDSERSGLDYLDPELEVDAVMAPVESVEATVVRVTGDTIEELALPPITGSASFSLVEAIAASDGGNVRALMAHNGADVEAHYASHLTVLAVDGATVESAGEVADLGESGPNHLVTSPDGQVEMLVNRSDGTYSRLRTSAGGGGRQVVQEVAGPRPGRVTAAFRHGAVVEDSDTEAVWESASGHPEPAILSEQRASGAGSPVLLPVTGDDGHAAAVVDARLVLVEI